MLNTENNELYSLYTISRSVNTYMGSTNKEINQFVMNVDTLLFIIQRGGSLSCEIIQGEIIMTFRYISENDE